MKKKMIFLSVVSIAIISLILIMAVSVFVKKEEPMIKKEGNMVYDPSTGRELLKNEYIYTDYHKEYDKNGNLIILEYTKNGETKERIEKIYNEQDELIKSLFYMGAHLIKESDYKWEAGRLVQGKDIEYIGPVRNITTTKYNIYGDEISVTKENDTKIIRQENISYIYDEGKVLTKIIEDSINNQRIVKEYKYDKKGNIVTILSSDGFKQVYRYDERGNCIEMEDYNLEGQLTYREYWEYYQ